MGYKKIFKTEFAGSGHYKVWIEFRNRVYFTTVSCVWLIENYKSNERGWKNAGNRLYESVVRDNNLR